MKKFVVLILGTVIALGVTFFTGDTIKATVPELSVTQIKKTSVEDTIICTGKVEYEKTRKVRSEAVGIIDSIKVKKGETVKKGQVLFTVLTSSEAAAPSAKEVTNDDIVNAIKSGDYSAINQYAKNAQENTSKNSANTTDGEIIEITAPMDGEILTIDESVGSAVNLSTIVITVVSGDKLCINLPVNESKIANLKIGQSAIITGNGFKNSTYKGTVSYIDKIAQQVSTGASKETAVEVKVRVNKAKKDIKQGYSAKCAITTAVNDNALIVPYDSIVYDDDGKIYVYVYRNGVAEINYITAGKDYDVGIEVVKGLNPNDLVVNNPELVCDMQKVRVTECVVNANV